MSQDSWEKTIKNILKTRQKQNQLPQGEACLQPKAQIMLNQKIKTAFEKIPEIAEGQTAETYKEHISLLKKEMKKPATKHGIVKKFDGANLSTKKAVNFAATKRN